MSWHLNFLTSKNNPLTIESLDPVVVDHFSDPKNNTDFIIDQFQEMRNYLDPVIDKNYNLSVLDIGANIGLFSLWISDSCKEIFTVEPHLETFNVLTKLTTGLPKITNLNVALSDHDGTTQFYLNENSTTNSILNRGGIKTDVVCLSLQSLVLETRMQHIDLCKIDIEGSEMLALDTIKLKSVYDKINMYYVEVHQTDIQLRPWPGNLEQNRDHLISNFINAGYNVLILDRDKIFTWRNQ